MKPILNSTKLMVVLMMVGVMLATGLPLAAASKDVAVEMFPRNFSALADSVSPAVVH
ncbi:MAG: hypothetical protein HKO68_20555, partial [Desulfobacterales bacterium]|nr:hypothetical protein [Desulfobacterales bacterium]